MEGPGVIRLHQLWFPVTPPRYRQDATTVFRYRIYGTLRAHKVVQKHSASLYKDTGDYCVTPSDIHYLVTNSHPAPSTPEYEQLAPMP